MMDYEKNIDKFKQRILIAQIIGFGIIIFGGICIYQWCIGNLDTKLKVLWLLFGLLFIFLGVFFIITSSKRPKRLIWIYKNIPPRLMEMRFEKKVWSDSTDYYAFLESNENQAEQWKTSIFTPSWDAEAFLNSKTLVKVYMDPKINKPAVIETKSGLLFVMGGS